MAPVWPHDGGAPVYPCNSAGDNVVTGSFPRRAAHVAIRVYQLTLSAFAGRHCRHLPTCSDFTDEAIARHGLWAGGWVGVARLWRCRPGGTSGFDPVPDGLASTARWYAPWRYGRWRAPLSPENPKMR